MCVALLSCARISTTRRWTTRTGKPRTFPAQKFLEVATTGCILGTGTFEAIARAYGVRRTFNFDSWRGKVFDQIDPSSVRNLIQLNYGTLLNSVFPRLAEPIELYPGRAEISSSNFQPGTNAVVVDYSSFDHDFTYFRDELRPIYPGVFLGKMYAMPGMSMFGGALQVPIGAAPVYTVSFILVGEPQTTMPLQRTFNSTLLRIRKALMH